ncbi:unnamed protein product, partial [Prorocentrum cordatum]
SGGLSGTTGSTGSSIEAGLMGEATHLHAILSGMEGDANPCLIPFMPSISKSTSELKNTIDGLAKKIQGKSMS